MLLSLSLVNAKIKIYLFNKMILIEYKKICIQYIDWLALHLKFGQALVHRGAQGACPPPIN